MSRKMDKSMGFLTGTIITALLILTFGTVEVSAHDPSGMTLDYDMRMGDLTVTITHKVLNPDGHYINEIAIFRNGAEVKSQSYDSQTSSGTNQYTFEVPAGGGDSIRVVATCNRGGYIERSLDVETPDAAMPEARASSGKTVLDPNEEAVLTGADSTDDGEIVSYSWAVDGMRTGTDETLAHSFDTIGDHEITLTVTDNNGNTDSDTVFVTVRDGAGSAFGNGDESPGFKTGVLAMGAGVLVFTAYSVSKREG